MSATGWSTKDIGDLDGTTALVTGATGGLGYCTALELLRHDADLVLTGRDGTRLRDVADRLRETVPGAHVHEIVMDLANLASVRHASQLVLGSFSRIDVLVNNAGIMAAPERRSADGFELHLATNHLGHFAWTAGLWPLLVRSRARVVTVSSLTHTMVKTVDLRSLSAKGAPRPYRRWRAYAESKLANLVFALELDRRVRAAGVDVTSVAAHPGLAATNLTATGPSLEGRRMWAVGMHQVTRAVGQSAAAGSWPLLMAATLPNLAGGSYIGPGRLNQARGRPRPVGMSAAARDESLARELWSASEAAVGAPFEISSEPPTG